MSAVSNQSVQRHEPSIDHLIDKEQSYKEKASSIFLRMKEAFSGIHDFIFGKTETTRFSELSEESGRLVEATTEVVEVIQKPLASRVKEFFSGESETFSEEAIGTGYRLEGNVVIQKSLAHRIEDSVKSFFNLPTTRAPYLESQWVKI